MDPSAPSRPRRSLQYSSDSNACSVASTTDANASWNLVNSKSCRVRPLRSSRRGMHTSAPSAARRRRGCSRRPRSPSRRDAPAPQVPLGRPLVGVQQDRGRAVVRRRGVTGRHGRVASLVPNTGLSVASLSTFESGRQVFVAGQPDNGVTRSCEENPRSYAAAMFAGLAAGQLVLILAGRTPNSFAVIAALSPIDSPVRGSPLARDLDAQHRRPHLGGSGSLTRSAAERARFSTAGLAQLVVHTDRRVRRACPHRRRRPRRSVRPRWRRRRR